VETRATLRPGSKGTRKLVERFGERLLRVRYLYDADAGRRYKTVELIVSSAPWRPRARGPRRRDEEMVAVRIAFHETELRERAKRLGALWRPAHRLWEMRWLDAKRLGVTDRVAPQGFPDKSQASHRHVPAETGA
jgi:hypothetical protein